MAMIEKGVEVEPTTVDPWTDAPRLRAANPATRVPTLVLDDGTALTESLLIVQWLEATRPEVPSLLGKDPAGVLSRAGVALGVIDAAAVTIITRKVTAPALFDETPVGLRRRRSMVEGVERLEAMAAGGALGAGKPPTLDLLAALDALDYLDFRFAGAPWLPELPSLRVLAASMADRPSVARTRPH
ncbi:MAG: glutathione S-transferase family protein [Burkholderiales bacterium]|nr:MAG: glutathione S-transferase family protein [Burkholderiales bacterium]